MKVSIRKVCISLAYVCIIVSQHTMQKHKLPSSLIAKIALYGYYIIPQFVYYVV